MDGGGGMMKSVAAETLANEPGLTENVFPDGAKNVGQTVRSSIAYDFDFTDAVPPADADCAARVKAELGDGIVSGPGNRSSYHVIKRIFDIVFSVAVILIGLIPWLILCIIVALDTKGTPLYSSIRVGHKGPFKLYKFRTMVRDSDDLKKYLDDKQLKKWHREHKVKHDPRVTRFGHMLRATSIDEFPQFINVLLGQIPLRILKMRQVFSKNKLGAFALPANEVRTDSAAFMQVKGVIRNCLLSLQKTATNFIRSCDNGREFFAKRSLGANRCSNNVGFASGLKSFVLALPSFDADGRDYVYCKVAA